MISKDDPLLSVLNEDPDINLQTNMNDVVASVVKMLPPPFGEIVASTIPDQKVERVIDFLQILRSRVNSLRKEQLDQKLSIEEIADLAEDAIKQSSRALTPERRQHIANLFTNLLTNEELEFAAKKKLLWILSELNDLEIILLVSKGHALDADQMQGFIERNIALFEPQGTNEEMEMQDAFLKQYQGTLARHGLIDGEEDGKSSTFFGDLFLAYLGYGWPNWGEKNPRKPRPFS